MSQQAVRSYSVSRDEAARLLGVHPETVRRWVASGRLHCERSTSGRMWFCSDDIDRLRLRVNGVVVEVDG